MSTDVPRHLLRLRYARAAEAYFRGLPSEHFMAVTAQATQREITLESFALVKARHPGLQYFNDLPIQYPFGSRKQIRQVMPDNLVVIHSEPIKATDSFDVPLQPVRPFWVVEYVSQNNPRKDYDDSFKKYERELKVPYYLVFLPGNRGSTLYHHTGGKYCTASPNKADRLRIPELNLEIGQADGWVRFWYKGKLLPLPAELDRQVEETRRQLRQLQKQARQAEERADQERREKERLLARLRELGIEPP